MEYQQIFGAFFLAAAIIGIFLLLVLWPEKNKDSPHRLLLALLVVMVFLLADSFVIALRIYRVFPHGLFVFSSLWLSVPALLFLYTREYSVEHPRFQKIDVLHFIPVLVYFTLAIPFYFLPAETKLTIGDQVYGQSSPPSWFSVLFFGQNYLYLFWLKQLSLPSESFKRKWLKNFWAIWLVVVVFDSLLSVWSLATGQNVSAGKDISILCFALMAFFIAYQLLKKPMLFFTKISRYDSSTASTEQLAHLASAAQKLMEKEKLFLQPDLRQKQLAKHLGTNSVVLSQMLNTSFQQNFNEWVNSYRMSFAQQLIRQGYLEKYSVEALAKQSGCASKVSFYRHFKRVTGRTPSDYQKYFFENKNVGLE